jgi:hypothetical protein
MKYQESLESRPPIPSDGDHSSNRYRDFFMLDYVVLSCCLNMPWIQSIHIIISELHDPPHWDTHLLNTSCPTIPLYFHTHQDLIRASGYDPTDLLPIFNSIVIELLFPFIPSLADYFFSFNDDQLVTKPLSHEDLFRIQDQNTTSASVHAGASVSARARASEQRLSVYFLGQHRAYRHDAHSHPEIAYLYTSKRLETVAERDPNLSQSHIQAARASLCWSMHAPYFLKREWMVDAINKVGRDVGLTLTHHTRKTSDINLMMALYPYYLLLYHSHEVHFISSCPSDTSPPHLTPATHHTNHFTNIESLAQMTKKDLLHLRQFQFLGVQDESGDLTEEEFQNLRQRVRENLSILFTQPTHHYQQRRLRLGIKK